MSEKLWNEDSNNWSLETDYWNFVEEFIEEVKGGVSGGTIAEISHHAFKKYSNLKDTDKEKIVRILCQIQNENYEQRIIKQNFSINISEIELLIKEIEQKNKIIVENIQIN